MPTITFSSTVSPVIGVACWKVRDRPSRAIAVGSNAEMSGFRNNWTLDEGRATPNFGLTTSLGDTRKIGSQRLGYFASVAYGHGYSRRLSHIQRPGGSDGMGGKLPSVLQLDDESGIENANLSAIGSAGWTPT